MKIQGALDDRIKDLEDKAEILKNAYNQLVENNEIQIDQRDQLVRDNKM